MQTTTQLTPDFLKAFEIAEVIEQKPRSGQKQVYIVKINDEIVALKIIPFIDARIERELKICEEFRENPGIPNLLAVKQYGDESVILEEFIAGSGLHLIAGEFKNNSTKVRNLIYDIASILRPIWEKGYVHRDIKPLNLIIKDDGNPVVLDFGIAMDVDGTSITPSGVRVLTWRYGSPEQFFYKSELIDYRTDFFCLGIIAYFLYTGGFPFGDTEVAVATRFQQDQIVFNLDDAPITNFLNKVLKFNVAERPRTFDAFIKSLGL